MVSYEVNQRLSIDSTTGPTVPLGSRWLPYSYPGLSRCRRHERCWLTCLVDDGDSSGKCSTELSIRQGRLGPDQGAVHHVSQGALDGFHPALSQTISVLASCRHELPDCALPRPLLLDIAPLTVDGRLLLGPAREVASLG